MALPKGNNDRLYQYLDASIPRIKAPIMGKMDMIINITPSKYNILEYFIISFSVASGSISSPKKTSTLLG